MILPRMVQSPLLRSASGVFHVFQGIDPQPGRGEEERLRAVFCVPPDRVGTLLQVHSGTALQMEEGDAWDGRRAGDALWTAVPGTGAGVYTADCVPVLLAHPGVPVCAAIHAGWRGLAADVIGEAVRAIAARFGSSAPDRILAAAGPSARGCCYEIGEEVADLLAPLPGGGRHLRKGGAPGKWTADLPSLAAEALVVSGIPRDRLEIAGPCTVCSRAFHSWRREKSLTGRQLSFIYIAGPPGGGADPRRSGRLR